MEPTTPSTQAKPKSGGGAMLLAVIALVVAVTAIGLLAAGVFNETDSLQSKIDEQSTQIAELRGQLDTIEQQEGFFVNDEVNQDGFQAVFLADGAVYFGKLSDGEPGQVKLENVYYLQGGEYQQNGEITGTGQISLAKLGNELHGPEDVMHISRDQVTFWENMKDDSQVVTAIIEYQTR